MGNQRFSMTPAVSVSDDRISDSVFRTLAAIGLYGDENGWCWPSQKTLSELRNVSRQTINTHIKLLTKLGYLNISPRYDEKTGAQKSNAMQIKFDYDFTGGVKSRALQGVSNPRLDRGDQALDLTHNTPLNAPPNKKIYIGGGRQENGQYVHPDPEPIAQIKTALSVVSKTPLWDDTAEQYDEAAYMLLGWDADSEQIDNFAEWWKKNGHYKGKPALKSLVNEWQNFTTKSTVSSNGDVPQYEQIEVDGQIMMRRIN